MTAKKLSSSLEVECFIDSGWKFNAIESVDLTDCNNARWTLSHNGESALLENHDGFLPDALIVELVSGRARVLKPSRRFIASNLIPCFILGKGTSGIRPIQGLQSVSG